VESPFQAPLILAGIVAVRKKRPIRRPAGALYFFFGGLSTC
jgi:hypothetical protein